MGSKNAIAEKIVRVLPAGERLVDLFGGGGAITHCASMFGVWNKILYNEYDKQIFGFFNDVVAGKYRNFIPKWVSREEFFKTKDEDPYVRLLWSFGNKGTSYMFSRKDEEEKRQLFELIVNKTPSEYFDIKPEWLTDNVFDNARICKRILTAKHYRFTRIQGFETIERLHRVSKIDISRVETSNISYDEYEYREGDVVYCDPPYENTEQYFNRTFDFGKFKEWALSRDYPVYISSYNLNDDRFRVVWRDVKLALLNDTVKNKKIIEYLYWNGKCRKNY